MFDMKIIADRKKARVILDFNKPIRWIEFDKEQIIELIKHIWEKVKILEENETKIQTSYRQ